MIWTSGNSRNNTRFTKKSSSLPISVCLHCWQVLFIILFVVPVALEFVFKFWLIKTEFAGGIVLITIHNYAMQWVWPRAVISDHHLLINIYLNIVCVGGANLCISGGGAASPAAQPYYSWSQCLERRALEYSQNMRGSLKELSSVEACLWRRQMAVTELGQPWANTLESDRYLQLVRFYENMNYWPRRALVSLQTTPRQAHPTTILEWDSLCQTRQAILCTAGQTRQEVSYT